MMASLHRLIFLRFLLCPGRLTWIGDIRMFPAALPWDGYVLHQKSHLWSEDPSHAAKTPSSLPDPLGLMVVTPPD